MWPLMIEKMQKDVEVEVRNREYEFLTFVWSKFHVFVTWSSPYYFEIVKLDAHGNALAS